MSITQITPIDALEFLKQNKNSILIDVRTSEEFNFVGFVDSSSFDNRMILIPWQTLPLMEENKQFAIQIEESLKKIFPNNNIKDLHLLFLCRTSARSNNSAQYVKNLGYKNSYNITNGFEGELDKNQQRGKINGWKANQLPWKQR